MYELANGVGEHSSAQHFLVASSMTPATPANLALVGVLRDSLRAALDGHGIEPLRRAVRRAEQCGSAVHDLLAAAEYEINESLLDQGLSVLHDAAVRLGSIVRDARRACESAVTVERRSHRRHVVYA